jgi:hypothetical protein
MARLPTRIGRNRPGVLISGLNSVAPYLLEWQRTIFLPDGQTVISGFSLRGSGGAGTPTSGDKLSHFARRGRDNGFRLVAHGINGAPTT